MQGKTIISFIQCNQERYLPSAQWFCFQKSEPSPLALHSFHAAFPSDVHHHHLEYFPGEDLLPQLCFFQKSELAPSFWQRPQSSRPSSLQNHHSSPYLSLPLDDRQQRAEVRRESRPSWCDEPTNSRKSSTCRSTLV